MADQIGFVDTIDPNPTVRLDLSDGTTWRVLLEGTDLSPAPLRRASSSNMLSDGDRIQASTYGDRVVDLALRLVTEDVDEVGEQIQALARELDRPSNILRWWPDGATEPVFFRTKRSPLGSIRQDLKTLHAAQVPILAEPFALGLEVALTPVVVSADPATGCYLEVPFPAGDVQTPLHLSFAAGGVIAAGRRQTVMAVRRRGTPGSAPWIIQAESMTLAANTALQANDAAMSGSGQNYVRASSLSGSYVTRLTSAVFPSSPSVDARGKYRVYLRYRKTNASGEVRVRLVVSPDGTTQIIPDTVGVVLPLDTVVRYADLGTVQLPVGDDPGTFGPSGVDLPCRGVQFLIQVSLTAGSSNLDADCLVLMPADDRLCRVLWPSVSGPTSMELDSRTSQVYALGSSGETYSTELRALDSGVPMISPGGYNLLRILPDAGTTSTAGDLLANTLTITPRYWPQYAYLRPALT